MHPRFLLVEDDLAHAELVSRGLERAQVPIRLSHVSDGEAAIAFLEDALASHEPLPALLLLDLRLPRMSGLAVLERVKAHAELRQVPVVVLSSSAARADVKRAHDHYVNSYLVKPLELDALFGLLAEVAAYWGARNRRVT